MRHKPALAVCGMCTYLGWIRDSSLTEAAGLRSFQQLLSSEILLLSAEVLDFLSQSIDVILSL